MNSSSSFRVGCSGNGELITGDELFEVLIMILPEAETIKSAFVKWVSLSEELKSSIEHRLESLTSSGSPLVTSSVKDLSLHKGYSMSRVLLRVFHEWNDIQVNLGAPGIQQGFTAALPKALEMDIGFMMRCVQEVFEFVIREQSDVRRRFLSRMKNPPHQRTEVLEQGGKEAGGKLPQISIKVKDQAQGRGHSIMQGQEPTPPPRRISQSDTHVASSPLSRSMSMSTSTVSTKMPVSMSGDHQGHGHSRDKVDTTHMQQQQMPRHLQPQLERQFQLERQLARQSKELKGQRSSGRLRKPRDLFGSGQQQNQGQQCKSTKSTGTGCTMDSSSDEECGDVGHHHRQEKRGHLDNLGQSESESECSGSGSGSDSGSSSNSNSNSNSPSASRSNSRSGSGSNSSSGSGSGSSSGSNSQSASPSASIGSGICMSCPHSEDDSFDMIGGPVGMEVNEGDLDMDLGMAMELNPSLIKYYSSSDNDNDPNMDVDEHPTLTLSRQYFKSSTNCRRKQSKSKAKQMQAQPPSSA